MNNDKHYQETRQVFDQIAAEKQGYYDADFTGKLKHSRFQLSVINTIGKIFETVQTPRNLEVGCGNGDFLLELAKKYPTLHFQGVDFSEAQIRLAGEYAHYDENLRFDIGNAQHLEFEENSFDTVLCVNMLHHIPAEEQKMVLEELTRVAKTHLFVEIKNAKNFYYKYIRTGFGSHHASFHYQGQQADSRTQPILVYPTTINAVATIVQRDGFELINTTPLWGLSYLSPLIVLHFECHPPCL